MGISFLFSFALASLLSSAICNSSSDDHFAFFIFFFLEMLLITASCTMSWTFIHSSSGTLSDLISWICLSLPLYNHKGFDLGHTWIAYGFHYFLQFKFVFCNKEFMIWATVSSWFWFLLIVKSFKLHFQKVNIKKEKLGAMRS